MRLETHLQLQPMVSMGKLPPDLCLHIRGGRLVGKLARSTADQPTVILFDA